MTAATVYIVDDNPMVRDSLAWLLDSIDLPSQAFADGVSFLENCPETRQGCIVLDIRMPKLDGFQVMERLNHCGCTLPIIIVTGHGDAPLANRALKAGAFDFIEKPYDNTAILERIQAAIASQSHERNLHS